MTEPNENKPVGALMDLGTTTPADGPHPLSDLTEPNETAQGDDHARVVTLSVPCATCGGCEYVCAEAEQPRRGGQTFEGWLVDHYGAGWRSVDGLDDLKSCWIAAWDAAQAASAKPIDAATVERIARRIAAGCSAERCRCREDEKWIKLAIAEVLGE